MAKGAGGSTFICLSSDEEGELESEGEDEGDSDYEESSDRSFCKEVEDGESDDSDENEDEDDDESLCNRVFYLLEEGGDLEALSLKGCKAYLRKHGLRIAGTKAVCIQRIVEHWRIKDGNAEALYPQSSFFINCTGDVCRGDVVLFTQTVYQRFDKMKRHGGLLGRRTVAGRVVKESYGAAKQQHTFTRWKNEVERRKVLAEKHRRGTATGYSSKTGESNEKNKDITCKWWCKTSKVFTSFKIITKVEDNWD